jgi:4-cresol dehydrogenase (hydroxylating) flavoprotein subunit
MQVSRVLDFGSPGLKPGLVEALKIWTGLLGRENVTVSPNALSEAAQATYQTDSTVLAILRPSCRAEVQEIVRIAREYGVPLYPVSTGKNWGYGSRAPASDCVLVDLGRMNRIVDFDERLAYVTVEPGVTQRQLMDFLHRRQSALWMDATGASPDCSLIGNVAERGFGHTPYGDHFGNSCSLEVVLGNGEVIETGFGRFGPSAHAAPTYRWGLGPSLDGLFSQSNFGIITRATVWLMPAPERFEAFFFRCDRHDGIAPLIEALRPLRLSGVLRSGIHIGNDYKVIAGMMQYPWEQTGGQTPLPRAVVEQLCGHLQVGAWNGSGALYGTSRQVAEARRLLKKALRGNVSRLQFVDDRLLRLAGRFAPIYRRITGWDLTRALELVRPVYGLMRGVPTAQPVGSCWWRKRTPAPAVAPDPDKAGCGLLWYAPVAPSDGRHARRLTNLASAILLKHTFEPQISLTLVNERSVACVISICYDREVAGEDDRAMVCHHELVRSLQAAGYYPYRLGIAAMNEFATGDSYGDVLRSLKRALDPDHIIAPGRYLR